MLGLLLVSLWAVMHVAQLVLAARAGRSANMDTPLFGSLLASAFPAAVLFLCVGVFVLGGASPVAELNSDATRSLWSLWVSVWPLAMLGVPLVGTPLTVAAVCPPYPPRATASFLSRLAGLNAGLCYAVVTYLAAPDA